VLHVSAHSGLHVLLLPSALQNFGLAEKGVEFCMKLLGRSGLGEQVGEGGRVTAEHAPPQSLELSVLTRYALPFLDHLHLNQTYFPPGLMSYPPDLSMQAARAEALYILSNALDSLFASTGIKPKEVDILIVNCSLFAPTPSLAAMIMNKYKMREDVDSYNLSGMVRAKRENAELLLIYTSMWR
jgi:hypothetical protein